ncbi:hypothetical protein PRIC2_005259 [Phytophthora ramorum]
MGRDDRSAPMINDHGFTINGCSFNVDPKYQPIDAIGQGSYGVVCSVRNTETDEKLAIKKITPMAGDEWDATHTLREIRLMRCLGAHENVISLKDLSMCKEKDELYMMMELADTDLHRLIQSSCPLTEGHIRVIMYQVLSGVKAMHDNGVLHRDLKPGNLLLNKDCELKITDFGLARMMPKKAQLGLEQVSNDVSPMMTDYDGAVDMWSVGCILGELVSRKPLFPGTDFMDQLTRVFHVLPVPAPEDRGYVIEKDALKFLSSLPPPAPGALETKLGDTASSHSLDLLRRLLCFNPKERISADDALAHPFFEGVQDEWGEITQLHLPHSLEFAFEAQSLPLATLRQYICDEVLAFADRGTKREPQPHENEPQAAKTERAAVSKAAAASSSNNDTPATLENDCPVGSGFTLKGCNFNVPSKYKPLQVLGEGSVLPVPPRDKRGYDVEGDALAFLDSLPPCSPSALSKLFRRASPEAVSLLRRLLCVNPARRISAKQALAHPYFKSIRAQLGEPPVFRVDKAFDFEFDYQEFSLAHLKTLIQSEVKLLQKDGLAPPLAEPEPAAAPSAQETLAVDEDHEDEVEQNKPPEAPVPVVTVPEDDLKVVASKAEMHAEPETDECEPSDSDSGSDVVKHRTQQRQQDEEEAEVVPLKKQPAAVESFKQNNDDDEKLQRAVMAAERSSASGPPVTAIANASSSAGVTTRRTSSASTRTTATSSSLARPKSAGTTRRSSITSTGVTTARINTGGLSYRSQRDSRDEDEVSSIASTSSNNRQHQNNNGSDSIEHGGKWGHPRTSAMASTASSRLHRSSGHSASTSSINAASERRSGIVKTAPIATRTGTSRVSASSNNNQLSARGGESIDRESVKSDALRDPERVSSTVIAATASSLRRQSSAAGTVRPTSSARKESLPEGWIRRTHSKSGREYFYDTLNKVASWKLPIKHQPLDNIFAGTSSSTTASSSRAAYGRHRMFRSSQALLRRLHRRPVH